MRHTATIRLSFVLCLALACSRADEAAAPATPDAAGAAETGSAASSESVTAPVVYAGNDYLCPDGKTFNARLDKGNVLLTAEGKTSTLAHDPASFDARYEGEGTLFIAQGNEAMLVRAGGAPQICKAQ